MVVPIAKLIDVFAKVVSAHLVVLTDNPSLQDRPEAFNGVRVNVPADVSLLMIDRLVPHEVSELTVTREFVGHDCCAFNLNLFPDEA